MIGMMAAGIEQHTITEASTALPGTTAAENNVNDPSSPASPTPPSFPETSGASDKLSKDHVIKSIVPSFTERTAAKHTDGTATTPVDTKTGAAKTTSQSMSG
jgi:hypothetical protein